jgi:SAM-dependent methyltransferase
LARWKDVLGVQAPYRWNLRRLKPGFTLEIGCGLGRNLKHLDGDGVGVDHNPHMVQVARSRGFQAFTPDEFRNTDYCKPNRFDCLLLSHVLEHMTEQEAVSVLLTYLPFLKTQGQVIVITPQEMGYGSDATHVRFVDFDTVRSIARSAGLVVVRQFSFPLPRRFGSLFKYNEFVSVSRYPGSAVGIPG